jgi:lysophospholipase L1-like esterase
MTNAWSMAVRTGRRIVVSERADENETQSQDGAQCSAEISDRSSRRYDARPTHTTATIVALGDSTTAGTPGFRSPLEAPPDSAGDEQSQYAYWLMRAQPGWRVLNRGVNGQRSDEIRARFWRDVVAAHPDVVVIVAGVNDIYQGRAPEVVQRELDALYSLALSAARPIAVVAGTILPYDTASPAEIAAMDGVNRWIRQPASDDPRIAFCDTRHAVAAPGAPDRLASTPDGLHPSRDGYRLMAQALEPVIRATLATRPRDL